MSSSLPKLYGYIACPYVQRIRFALEYLKVEYTYEEVDIVKYQQKTPEYLAINPFAKVPSIQLPTGEILFESLPLLEYLNDQYGGLLPAQPSKRAKHRIWANYFESNALSKFWTILPCYKARDYQAMEKITSQVLDNLSFFAINSGIVQQINKNPDGLFEEGSQERSPSFMDFVVVPSLRALDIFYRRLNADDVLARRAMKDPAIAALIRYYQNGLQIPCFKKITTDLKEFPPKNKNSLLGDWEGKQFNYEEFALIYQRTKYNA